jgi:hypothetical protein
MQDSCSPIYMSAAKHHGVPSEAKKRIHKILCLPLVGNRHVQYYIGAVRWGPRGIRKAPIVTVDFGATAGGRFALTVLESGDFVPALN